MLSEEERLEEELRFLKESFDIGVITDQEYENGKQRLESRLEELEKKENAGDGIFKDIPKIITEAAEEEPKVKVKFYSNTAIAEAQEESSKEEKIKPGFLKRKKEEKAPEIKEPLVEEYEEAEKEEDTKYQSSMEEDIFPLDSDDEIEAKKERVVWKKPNQQKKAEDKTKLNKRPLVLAAVFIAAALGIWYFLSSGNTINAEILTNGGNEYKDAAALIACHSSDDCKEQGKIGECINPGKENAKCAFAEDARIKLTVLSSNSCFNCQTGRVLSIIKDFFPNLEISNIDLESANGREAAETLRLDALPAFIFNSSIKEGQNYGKFLEAFEEINGNFVMKNTVSNANYYFKRDEIPGKLDLFVKEGQEASSKAEKNLNEFLGAFEGKVAFNKHDSESALAKELGLNSFPVFLVNNQIKFSGVQPADQIKENFCKMNRLTECSLELSKSLS